MREDEARRVQRALELIGLSGEAHAEDTADPEGPWRIYDGGRDVTLRSLDALIEHLGGEHRDEPGWHGGRPVRGFLFPPKGRGAA